MPCRSIKIQNLKKGFKNRKNYIKYWIKSYPPNGGLSPKSQIPSPKFQEGLRMQLGFWDFELGAWGF